MTDLIVFSVGGNRYAMSIEQIQRIVQAQTLTEIPNSHAFIDGMMSYEEKVIKVLNFRKLIGMKGYESELEALFISLKAAHGAWVGDLRKSLETGCEFTKTLDPHACGLGKWIDSFTAYDDHVVEILNELIEYHKKLHLAGGVALNLYKSDKEAALVMLNKDIENIYHYTMGALDSFTKELDIVANSLQKLLIYDCDGKIFAIKVDAIEDIAHVQADKFVNSGDENESSAFLELDGVIDLDSLLINVVKTVHLPK